MDVLPVPAKEMIRKNDAKNALIERDVSIMRSPRQLFLCRTLSLGDFLSDRIN